MIILLSIYFIIYVYIIFKSFIGIKKTPLNNIQQKFYFFKEDLAFNAMPFYLKQLKIQEISLILNLFLLIFIYLYNFNNITFCMENINENTNNFTKLFQDEFALSDFKNMFKNNPNIENFIYDSNIDRELTPEENEAIVNIINDEYLTSYEQYLIDTQSEHFLPTIESFGFPAIKKLNIFDFNYNNTLSDLDKEINLAFRGTVDMILNFKNFPFGDSEGTDLESYHVRLGTTFDRNSLLISKLYMVHNKAILPYVNDTQIENDSSLFNNFLNRNRICENFDSLLKNNIKNFFFKDLSFYEKLDKKIKFLSCFLEDFNNKISMQLSILDEENCLDNECINLCETTNNDLSDYLEDSFFTDILVYQQTHDGIIVNVEDIPSKYTIFQNLERVSFQ